jgi:hypothetical protein
MTECSEIALSLVDELSSTPSQRFVFVPCWMLDMFRVLEMYLSLTYESISPCSPMKIFIRNAKGNTVPGRYSVYRYVRTPELVVRKRCHSWNFLFLRFVPTRTVLVVQSSKRSAPGSKLNPQPSTKLSNRTN